MREAHIAADENVVAAMALLLGDRVRAAAASRRGPGTLPAAIVTLAHHRSGRSVDQLARALEVSHSRAVRLVDAMEADGLAIREADPADRRAVIVMLSARGRRAARGVLAARRAAVADALAPLTPAERRLLAGVAAKVLAAATHGREEAHVICRLCDSRACGHDSGRCPVTRAADAAEAEAERH